MAGGGTVGGGRLGQDGGGTGWGRMVGEGRVEGR